MHFALPARGRGYGHVLVDMVYCRNGEKHGEEYGCAFVRVVWVYWIAISGSSKKVYILSRRTGILRLITHVVGTSKELRCTRGSKIC